MKSPLDRLYDDVMSGAVGCPFLVWKRKDQPDAYRVQWGDMSASMNLATLTKMRDTLTQAIDTVNAEQVSPSPTQQACVFCGKEDSSDKLLLMGNGAWMHEEPCTSLAGEDTVRMERV